MNEGFGRDVGALATGQPQPELGVGPAGSRDNQIAPLQADQRRAGRSVAWITRVILSTDGRTGSTATLLDLSRTGCRLSSPATVAKGDRVLLRLEGSPPIGATIVWSRYGEAGCAFDEALPPGFVRALTLQSF